MDVGTLAPLWRAADDAFAVLASRTDFEDEVAVQAAARTMLNSLYDLAEAWKFDAFGSAKGSNAQQNAAAAGAEGGRIALAMIYARGEATHALALSTRPSRWGEGIYGAGVFGSANWRWATQVFRPTTNRVMAERSRWFEQQCAEEMIKPTVTTAMEWLASLPSLDRPSGGVPNA